MRRERELRFGALMMPVVLAASFFAVTAPVGAAATASTSPVATVVVCSSPGLVIWINTNGNGAAGSSYYDLEFTNQSGHACTMTGYPGVSGVNLAGKQLGRAATRDAVVPSKAINLRNGATATAVVRIVDVENYPAATCGPVVAAGLRVYAPNNRTSKIVPFPLRACEKSGPTYLSVEAAEKSSQTAAD